MEYVYEPLIVVFFLLITCGWFIGICITLYRRSSVNLHFRYLTFNETFTRRRSTRLSNHIYGRPILILSTTRRLVSNAIAFLQALQIKFCAIFAVLGFHATYINIKLQTFRDKLLIHFQRSSSAETSVTNCQQALRNIPEERRLHLHHAGSMKSRIKY
jgi:hypothetical protein